MPSRLLNVRLDGDRARKARRLREAGVTLSDLVREAIDARFEALDGPVNGRAAVAAVTRVLEEFPDPADTPRRTYDVHDGPAARAAIRRTITRHPR